MIGACIAGDTWPALAYIELTNRMCGEYFDYTWDDKADQSLSNEVKVENAMINRQLPLVALSILQLCR